jgi:hypothetical protein
MAGDQEGREEAIDDDLFSAFHEWASEAENRAGRR